MIHSERVLASLRRLGASAADSADRSAVELAVHPDDAMLAFALRSRAGALDGALDEYFRSALEADRVVEWALDATLAEAPTRSDVHVLDFGAGHGRVTRFLSGRVPADRLLAVEADPSGVAHLERLGVRAALGPLDPARFDPPRPPRGFDRIFAFSVLSHLPERTFDGWLRRWLELLAPGGVLVASSLGPETLLAGRSMPADGFHFERVSESRVLETADYGTAWVSEERGARSLERASEALGSNDVRWRRFPRALWQLQDLWVVTRGDHPLLAASPPPTSTGRLEALALDPTGRSLHLAGWSARRTPGGVSPARFELRVGERAPIVVDPVLARSDVAALLGAPSGLTAGFALDLPAGDGDPFAPDEVVRLTAEDHPPFAVGPLAALELSTALEAASAARDDFEARLEIVEASGFGRARRAWMRAKARLGVR